MCDPVALGIISGVGSAVTGIAEQNRKHQAQVDAVNRSNQIARVTDLPTLVDIDTGFGNCKKTIEVFENKGLAGCHLEDQIAEKRCGHLDNKELVSKEEMMKKIQESVKARKDKNFLIIARTDANSVEGLNKTLERIKAYEDAGADMIFPEAMKDESEFEKVRKAAKGYLLANMTEFGKSKLFNYKELENFGYNIKTGEYINMVENGIIDPTKVTRTALENAVSVAGTMLITECTIVDDPEEDKEADPMSMMGM